MSNTKYLLMSGIGKPYDPNTGTGVVGKNFCHQTMSGVNVHFKDCWLNPFLASGSSQTCIDEFNEDNFDHGGLGFFGGGYVYSNVTTGRRSAIGYCRQSLPRGEANGRDLHLVPCDWICAVPVRNRAIASTWIRRRILLPRHHQFLRKHIQQDRVARAVRGADVGDVSQA
jgi:hypothetical protein